MDQLNGVNTRNMFEISVTSSEQLITATIINASLLKLYTDHFLSE